jgi:hypothetical protein
MYLLYLDDSGSLGNTSEEYLVLAGIAVFNRQVHWLGTDLDQIEEACFGSLDEPVDFHASEIWARHAPWTGLDNDSARALIKRVLAVAAPGRPRRRPVLFGCAVRKDHYPDTFACAYTRVVRAFDCFLTRLHSHEGHGYRGLVVMDKMSLEPQIQRLALDLKRFGCGRGQLYNLIDVPFFVNSRVSRMIQLADHVAYAVRRLYEVQDGTYFNVVSDRFDTDAGVVYGLIHLDREGSRCTCPACLSRRAVRAQRDATEPAAPESEDGL